MYIDPGLGSIVILAIVGFIVAIPVYMGIYWRKFKSWFRREENESK